MEKLELVYLPKGKYCVYPRMVYRLAIVMPPPHIGWPEMNFDRISRHFRSIRNFDFFFTKWLPAAIFDDRKSLSIAFLAISDQYATSIFSQNGCQRPFWMTENHFLSHFSPFQINTQLFFSQNGCQRPYWMTEIHLDRISRHFRSIHNFFVWFVFQNGRQRPFWKSDLRQIQSGSSTMCYQWLCQIWIWPMNLWHS